MNCVEPCWGPVPDNDKYHGQGTAVIGLSDSCPERTAKLLVRSGWCFTEFGWSHEKIAPVFVAWREAITILAMKCT